MEEFEFPSRKVHLIKEIGNGAFGKVYRHKYDNNPTVYFVIGI